MRQYPDVSSPLLIGPPINMHMTDFLSIHAPAQRTPLEALSQLIVCAKQGKPAPQWTGEVLENAIAPFLRGADEHEEGDIGKALGFHAGRGETSEAEARLLSCRDLVLLNYVWGLHACGIPVDDACSRVVEWFYAFEIPPLYYQYKPKEEKKESFKRTIRSKYYEWRRTHLEIAKLANPQLLAGIELIFQDNKSAIVDMFPAASS